MARRYFIKGAVSNGSFTTEDMSASYAYAELSHITFYSDAYVTQVTPTAGTVTYKQSADGVNYRDMPEGTFNASAAYDADRTPPNGTGMAVKGQLTLSGVTGATHFIACVWRY